MFTGIVQTIGRITSLEPGEVATRLTIALAGELAGETRPPRVGDSIALAGVCLTVADLTEGALHFDVVPETLRCTKLGKLRVGDAINLEPAVAPNQPLGGHFMQGHVDALGQVLALDQAGDETRLAIELDDALRDYITPKGSIAIDGVSLTVATVKPDRFEIALIPTTLEHTTLGQLKADDVVNLETDMIARTVVQWLERHGGVRASAGETVTRRLLEQTGFNDMP
jgi:riboflavin synthase